jgi:ABC-type polysaccharide/polyol phosphate transport system ATPase subunit
MTTAISFENVSKHYRGELAYGALRDDVMAAARRLVGQRRERRTVKALTDVSFEIREGESVAFIGLNGAGKTTALKLTTRITYPTAGLLRVRGRVGALIEVGTGMHPELTGRENIALYGRILGLSRQDIARRFDDIVEFSGIGAALDQPVKQYSSGMQLRIGFSVAAHVEPDVFLVDEAIAVGDAGFQHRCVERMASLVREGRTLVFVSHEMSAIETLCDRAIMLGDGRIVSDGPARDVVREYLLTVQRQLLEEAGTQGHAVGEGMEITHVEVIDAEGRAVDEVPTDTPMTVRLHYRTEDPIVRPIFSVGLSDRGGACFVQATMLVDGNVPDRISGEGYVDCEFLALPLQPKAYSIWGEVIGDSGFGEIVDWQRLRWFRVASDVTAAGKSAVTHSMTDAPVRLPYRWSVRDGS